MDPAAARSLAERAGERQDILDARVVADNINREFAGDEAFDGMDGRQGGSRQLVPGAGRGRYTIPRSITVTRVGGGEDRPSKGRKGTKVATSDAFPEHEYPEGYTKEQLDLMELTDVIMLKDMQQKQRKLARKDVPLPGNLI